MGPIRRVVDRYAADAPYEELARGFREFERWTGDDPLLLVAEAAASTTGQSFLGGVQPAVRRFEEAFVATGRLECLAELAAVDPDDDALVEALGAERNRHVALEVADVLADRPAEDDLAALRNWAAAADHYRYDEDPIGRITGVGPSSFQYLRQLAGVDAARPDSTLVALLEAVADELEACPPAEVELDGGGHPAVDLESTDGLPISTESPRRTIASCDFLSSVTPYRRLELDCIAWWTFTDPDEREAALAAQLS